MRDTLGWIRSSLISHSRDVRCPVLWDPCIRPGDRSTGLGIRGSDAPALGSRGVGRRSLPYAPALGSAAPSHYFP